jgi:hypothetical protein
MGRVSKMTKTQKHLNNENEIKKSKEVGCLYCFRKSSTDELEWLDESFKKIITLHTFCPKCQVADKLLGDESGIPLTEQNLKSLSYELFHSNKDKQNRATKLMAL